MKIAFTAALLLGLASARNILTSISGDYTMFSAGILTIFADYAADIGYSTSFGIAEDSTDAYLWTAEYALAVDSYGSYSQTWNFGDIFSYKFEVEITLFDVTPYAQYITVTRPDAILYDSSATYQVSISAERDVTFGFVELTHTPDVLVTSVSFYDAIVNLISGLGFTLADWIPSTTAQWALQEDSDVSITDSYLAYNIPEDLFGLTNEWYYGTQEYYSYTLSL